MKVTILAIGRAKRSREQDLALDYLSRAEKIGRNIGLSGLSLVELQAHKDLPSIAKTEREGQLIAEAAKGSVLFLLDEHGENLSSADLSALIQKTRDENVGDMTFAIGGADGHSPAISKIAFKSISFGRATWPHLLVRVMIAEQLYRAMTMLSNHPYHRE